MILRLAPQHLVRMSKDSQAPLSSQKKIKEPKLLLLTPVVTLIASLWRYQPVRIKYSSKPVQLRNLSGRSMSANMYLSLMMCMAT